ncbi:hypothetical protein HY995_05250 [Candidatus Micrarchaeota archaeon]|nr:hypothetical protein [Candidatus Micrarchaeota archaeon]MBI5177461.1 hypothetical protein [Candidatus Micrarchaeota archaeon]
MASLLFRRILVILLLVFIVAMAYSFTRPRGEVASSEDAVRFVKDDLASDPLLAAGNYLSSIFSSERQPDGTWQVTVKVTRDPHSACPRAFIRTYDLLPIRHALDKAIAQNCAHSGAIAFPEEAILQSAQLPEVKAAIANGAASCGYGLPLNPARVREYCPDADLSSLSKYASQLPAAARWLVEWKAPGFEPLRVAYDGKANRLA